MTLVGPLLFARPVLVAGALGRGDLDRLRQEARSGFEHARDRRAPVSFHQRHVAPKALPGRVHQSRGEVRISLQWRIELDRKRRQAPPA
jgi:hypothetical protein